MKNLPIPTTQDANLLQCLILLNQEIEELKKQIAELKKAKGA